MSYRDNRRSSLIDPLWFENSRQSLSWHSLSESQDSQPGDRPNDISDEALHEDYWTALSEAVSTVYTNWDPPTCIMEQDQQDKSSVRAILPKDTHNESWASSSTHSSSQRQSGSDVSSTRPSTTLSWRTALSNVSHNTSLRTRSFHSAKSHGLGTGSTQEDGVRSSTWIKYIRTMKIMPEPELEKNWSGRGQHVEFFSEHDVPLQVEKVLGFGTALVESVRCRRIRLARKTIQSSYRLRKEDAIKEVEHLQRLQHAHIIQLVGTYVCGRQLLILLYPVAEYTLDVYMDILQNDYFANDEQDSDVPPSTIFDMQDSFKTFFSCLSRAMAFIHKNLVKHMDIKPKNILVKEESSKASGRLRKRQVFKIFIADFGISRSYASIAEVCTDSPTSFTRLYAAPEVIGQLPRDLSADIFSLGCVFVEMLATLETFFPHECRKSDNIFSKDWFVEFRRQQLSNALWKSIPESFELYQTLGLDGLKWICRLNERHDRSYQANARTIIAWLSHANSIQLECYPEKERLTLLQLRRFTNLVCAMLDQQPGARPTSSHLDRFFNRQLLFPTCDCGTKPDPFEAAVF